MTKAVDRDPAWDSVWVYDHVHAVTRPELKTTFASWIVSATLARDTMRVKISQLVGCSGYRNQAVLGSMASTIDIASLGRLYTGAIPRMPAFSTDTTAKCVTKN